ncbi:unnamed protein product [Ostreobium quekettii]|uniref:cysteine-S-conjugate beta-lyase n=1 Tax=Ostreobium quekettii TaxID=121088 RepID=A0A8S1JAY1_9CHLO|nr:unnamed protein product [Ostreobium quekettii]|eukprot:evm.model.scf_441EXC.5 EVM.evm.TU.scf_441EXC.5   scf_441EXC:27750-31495(+)
MASAGGPQSNGSGRPLRFATRILHPDVSGTDPYKAVAPPLYQTATFDQPSATECGPYDYTRSGNPTRTLLEEQMARLEGGCRSFAFASGMAAISVACQLVKSGGHILAGDDIYGGTSRLLANVLPAGGVEVTNVDATDLVAVAASIRPGQTKMVMLESPTNPRMQILDIRKIVELAHEAGALVLVDNSIMAPTFCQPLELGADISMTSATKFIAGHSDVTGGILTVKDKDLADRIYFLQNAVGSILGPFDCWLCLRGLKTMALRMERQADNASRMAQFLDNHKLVKKVNYAGLPNHKGRDLHFSQASSAGSLVSFTTGNLELSKVIVEGAKLFKIAVSFGSVISSISLPCFMSHASVPAEVRAERGLPDDLIRISAGIEDVEDLIADLSSAMDKAEALVNPDSKQTVSP